MDNSADKERGDIGQSSAAAALAPGKLERRW